MLNKFRQFKFKSTQKINIVAITLFNRVTALEMRYNFIAIKVDEGNFPLMLDMKHSLLCSFKKQFIWNNNTEDLRKNPTSLF